MHSTGIFVSSLASLASLALAIPAPAPAPAVLPIGRGVNHYQPRSDGQVNGPSFLQALNGTLKKYGGTPLAVMSDDSGILKRATAEVPLTDQVTGGEDELYYGNTVVGSKNPQTFTTDFDTGSADYFVPGPKCGSSQGCVGSTKYDQEGTSEGNTTSITYGSGQVSGNNYFDTVCVGGLCAPHTNVISLTTAEGFSTSASEGLMGMGFSTIANSKQPTFFERLMSLNKVTKNEFSFYLGRAASNTQSGSELTLGGRDSSKYTGSFTSVPVTTKGYWQVALDGVVVSGKKALGTAGQAAIDTGTTIILAPTAAALSIFSQIPGAFPVPLASGSPTLTIFAYPCGTKAIPKITFAGKDFAINPLDFSLGTISLDFATLLGGNALSTLLDKLTGGGLELCLASVAGDDISPTEELYVVGDSFLKNWYATFDYDNGASVNFAKAV